MAEGQVVNVTLISKLSMRTIKTKPANHATEEGAAIAVIYGQASGIKEVVDKTRGDVYHALTGEFEAQNLKTGEVFRSGQLYLPTGIHEMVAASVAHLEEDSDFVRFALQIKAVKAANPAGYSYQAVSLLKPVTVDPLESLRGELTAAAPSKQLSDGKGAKSTKKN